MHLARALGAKKLPSPSLAGNTASNAIHGGVNYASGASGILEATGTLFVRGLSITRFVYSV